MEENVKKEMNDLKMIVKNWTLSYLKQASVGDTFLLDDFNDEIQTHLYPYIARLRETEYITLVEEVEFWNYVHSCFNELASVVRG